MVESTALEMRRTGNCTEGSNPSLSANISSRIHEMGLSGAENLQLPRRFTCGTQTPETGGNAKSSLWVAFVSFHLNLIVENIGLGSDAFLGFSASCPAIPFQCKPDWRCSVRIQGIWLV